MAKRWGRVRDDGYIVEFTFIDPSGRFHPDIVWVEVDMDTKLYTKLVHFGSEEVQDPEGVIGVSDPDVLLKQAALEAEKEAKEQAERAKNPLSDWTLNLVTD